MQVALPLQSQAPSNTFAAVTPSDTANLPTQARGLFIGTGGNVSIVGIDGHAEVFTNIGNGTVLPVNAVRVNAAGTSASGIIALF